MKLTREHLIFKALCVLRAWADHAVEAPVRPDLGARFALAFLYTCGKGNRRLYDDFWRELSNPGHPSQHESMNRHRRQSYCNTHLTGIMLDVGAPMTPEFSQAVAQAVRKGLDR